MHTVTYLSLLDLYGQFVFSTQYSLAWNDFSVFFIFVFVFFIRFFLFLLSLIFWCGAKAKVAYSSFSEWDFLPMVTKSAIATRLLANSVDVLNGWLCNICRKLKSFCFVSFKLHYFCRNAEKLLPPICSCASCNACISELKLSPVVLREPNHMHLTLSVVEMCLFLLYLLLTSWQTTYSYIQSELKQKKTHTQRLPASFSSLHVCIYR